MKTHVTPSKRFDYETKNLGGLIEMLEVMGKYNHPLLPSISELRVEGMYLTVVWNEPYMANTCGGGVIKTIWEDLLQMNGVFEK